MVRYGTVAVPHEGGSSQIRGSRDSAHILHRYVGSRRCKPLKGYKGTAVSNCEHVTSCVECHICDSGFLDRCLDQ